MKKTINVLAISTQLMSSLSGMFCIIYIIVLTMSLGFIIDPGNQYNPQLGQDGTTKLALYLLKHPGLIILGILNITYSIRRGFNKSKKHLNMK